MRVYSRYISETAEYLTKEAISEFNVKIVPVDTIILSFKLTLGRVSITDTDLCTNEAIAHLNTDKPHLLEFMYCLLKRYNYNSLGNTSSIGTAVNSKTIRSMPIQVPDDRTIKNFHTCWNPLMNIMRTLEREIRNLRMLRDYLLSSLMSREFTATYSV